MQMYSNGAEIYPPNFQNIISIVMSASEEYLPYTAVTISSILRHGSKECHFDLIVLHQQCFSQEGINLLQQVTNLWNNCTLRLLCVNRKMESYYVSGHVATETYVRLLLPELLPNYDKVIYLDSDLVVLRDISELWFLPVDRDIMLAGVADLDVIGQYCGTEFSMRYYINHILKLSQPEKYIQAGVLCFFLNAIRAQLNSELLAWVQREVNCVISIRMFLNAVCQKKIALLDCRWNVVSDCDNYRVSHIISQTPKALFHAYMQSRQEPWIVHYSGYHKPWEFPQEDLSAYFKEEVQFAHLEPYVYKKRRNEEKTSSCKRWIIFFVPKQSIRRELIKCAYFHVKYHLEKSI